MIVSARGSEHDKVHALGIGGDDYLAKPFGMRELVARVEAVLRRAGMTPAAAGGERIEAEGLVIDPDLHAAHAGRRGRGADADGVPAAVRAGRRAAAARSPATSCSSGCGASRTATATAPSTSASASCATRSTAASSGHTYIQTHYGVGYRFERGAQTGRLTASVAPVAGAAAGAGSITRTVVPWPSSALRSPRGRRAPRRCA